MRLHRVRQARYGVLNELTALGETDFESCWALNVASLAGDAGGA
jgi:hypothetical protein